MSQLQPSYASGRSLLTLLYDSSRSSPETQFLVETQDSFLTYQQTYTLVSTLLPARIQNTYPSIAKPRSHKVILVSPNNAMVPLVMWALWFMSKAVAPISPKADPTIFVGMVEVIHPDLILYAGSLEKLISGVAGSYECPAIRLEDIIPKAYQSEMSASRVSDFIPSLINWLTLASYEVLDTKPSIDADQCIICLFTSSAVDVTTLKCVSYTHAMLTHSGDRFLETTRNFFQVKGLRHLGFLPLTHCFELCFAFLTLVLRTGGTYIIFDRTVSSPEFLMSAPLSAQLLQSVKHYQPLHSICLVPAIFESITEGISSEGQALLKQMKFLCVGGAPASERLFKWAADQDLAYTDACGATELTGLLGLRSASNSQMKSYGLQIITGMGGLIEKEKAEDTYGELIIRGQHLPRGYDNIESTAFSYNTLTGVTTYRTGDLYKFAPSINDPLLTYVIGQDIPLEGTSDQPLRGLQYIGRIDDLAVLSSGLKVDALPLEHSLNSHPHILRSAFIPSFDRQTLAVLIQLAAEGSKGVDKLVEDELLRIVLDLNHQLVVETRIQTENIFLVDSLPVTTKMTLNRKLVRKIWAENLGEWPGAKRVAEQIRESSDSERNHKRVAILLAKIFSIPADYFSNEYASLADIPLTSLDSVRLARALEDEFSIRVTEAQLYGLRSVRDIHALVGRKTPVFNLPRPPTLTEKATDVGEHATLVITGSACRFPGHIHCLADFSSALLDPRAYAKTVTKNVPVSRWKVESIPDELIPPISWLEDDKFENLVSLRNFFNLSPADAESLSPNACLALQLGYQAIEDASISPRALDGKNWGIFTSVNSSGWRERRVTEMNMHQYSMSIVGSADDAVGARLSYFLNLAGPAIEVKTACSSSAVAIHQACAAIQNGDCDAALVIASTTHFHPSGAIFRRNAGLASKSGRCATFSDNADGFLPSEGAAAIVIQRASDARCKPYARIRGSHVAQNGRSHGFFSPNPLAQERLVRRALEKASCSTEDIDYYETHGTGTRIGDAIELQTVERIFTGKRSKPLPLGSVKAVLGHTEECAGLASVLKSIACFRDNVIPPQPNVARLNQQIDFVGSKMVVHQRPAPFLRGDSPRHIGISSFGLSGTLAHIILEDQADLTVEDQTPALKIFLLSAANQASFKSLLSRHADYTVSAYALEDDIDSICRTSQLGRDHFSIRRAWHVQDMSTLSMHLFNELEHPSPYQARKSLKLGLWFGLPASDKSRSLSSPVLNNLLPQILSESCNPEYSFFSEQLLLANMLRLIGCDVSVVGGEGVAEYAAAIFADIFPLDTVFSRRAGGAERNISVVRGVKESIFEYLTQFSPSRLVLRGSIGPTVFFIEGEYSSARALIDLGGFELLDELSFFDPDPIAAVASPASMTYVSSILGEVIDHDVLSTQSYWSNVAAPSYAIDGSGALKAMQANCDVIVTLGGQATWYETDAAGSGSIVHMAGKGLESALAQLYERGASIDWSKFGADGPRSHLPGYEIL